MSWATTRSGMWSGTSPTVSTGTSPDFTSSPTTRTWTPHACDHQRRFCELVRVFPDPLNRAPACLDSSGATSPVMLITIPGNYADGGWKEERSKEIAFRVTCSIERFPPAKPRFGMRSTHSARCRGVRQLLEQTTTGPLLILGHSTGGEIQFLLKESSLTNRLNGRSIGWGTGGPASITREIDERFGERPARVTQFGRYPRAELLRARDAAGYVSSGYVGPLNPLKGRSPLDVANAWFAAENQRRPQFKQVLQDMEHQGMVEHSARLEKEIRETLNGTRYGVRADAVIPELFSTMTPPLKGYRKMAWVVGQLDDGHWDPEPEKAREWNVAERFRRRIPSTRSAYHDQFQDHALRAHRTAEAVSGGIGRGGEVGECSVVAINRFTGSQKGISARDCSHNHFRPIDGGDDISP